MFCLRQRTAATPHAVCGGRLCTQASSRAFTSSGVSSCGQLQRERARERGSGPPGRPQGRRRPAVLPQQQASRRECARPPQAAARPPPAGNWRHRRHSLAAVDVGARGRRVEALDLVGAGGHTPRVLRTRGERVHISVGAERPHARRLAGRAVRQAAAAMSMLVCRRAAPRSPPSHPHGGSSGAPCLPTAGTAACRPAARPAAGSWAGRAP